MVVRLVLSVVDLRLSAAAIQKLGGMRSITRGDRQQDAWGDGRDVDDHEGRLAVLIWLKVVSE